MPRFAGRRPGFEEPSTEARVFEVGPRQTSVRLTVFGRSLRSTAAQACGRPDVRPTARQDSATVRMWATSGQMSPLRLRHVAFLGVASAQLTEKSAAWSAAHTSNPEAGRPRIPSRVSVAGEFPAAASSRNCKTASASTGCMNRANRARAASRVSPSTAMSRPVASAMAWAWSRWEIRAGRSGDRWRRRCRAALRRQPQRCRVPEVLIGDAQPSAFVASTRGRIGTTIRSDAARNASSTSRCSSVIAFPRDEGWITLPDDIKTIRSTPAVRAAAITPCTPSWWAYRNTCPTPSNAGKRLFGSVRSAANNWESAGQVRALFGTGRCTTS